MHPTILKTIHLMLVNTSSTESAIYKTQTIQLCVAHHSDENFPSAWQVDYGLYILGLLKISLI